MEKFGILEREISPAKKVAKKMKKTVDFYCNLGYNNTCDVSFCETF